MSASAPPHVPRGVARTVTWQPTRAAQDAIIQHATAAGRTMARQLTAAYTMTAAQQRVLEGHIQTARHAAFLAGYNDHAHRLAGPALQAQHVPPRIQARLDAQDQAAQAHAASVATTYNASLERNVAGFMQQAIRHRLRRYLHHVQPRLARALLVELRPPGWQQTLALLDRRIAPTGADDSDDDEDDGDENNGQKGVLGALAVSLSGMLALALQDATQQTAGWAQSRLSWKAQQVGQYESADAWQDGADGWLRDLLDGALEDDALDQRQLVVAVMPEESSADECADYAGDTFDLDQYDELPDFPMHENCIHTKYIMRAGDDTDLDEDEDTADFDLQDAAEQTNDANDDLNALEGDE